MNYSAIYSALMLRAAGRTIQGYSEKHHVIPRCLGGGDEPGNVVTLTAREHYVAHQLLVKLNPGHMGLSYAAHQMGKKRLIGKHSSRKYEWLRLRASADRARSMRGKKRPAAAVAGMLAASRRPKSAEHRAKLAAANTGKRASPETRARLSIAQTGRPVSEQTRKALSDHMRGKRHGLGNKSRAGMTNSPETRAKIVAAQTGKRHSAEWRQNISKGQASLSVETVRAIRSDFDGKMSLAAICRKYGVSGSHGRRIANRISYRWVA